MDYRSNGIFAVDKQLYKTLVVLGQDASDFLNNCCVEQSKDAYYFSYCDWKMYNHFPNVRQFYDMLNLLENTPEYGAKFAYVEAGEDEEDFTLRGACNTYHLEAGTEIPEGYHPENDDPEEYPFAYAGFAQPLCLTEVEVKI